MSRIAMRITSYAALALLWTASAWAERSLLNGDVASWKSSELRIESGKADENPLPVPWTGRAYRNETDGAIRVGLDPLTQTMSLGVLNLEGPASTMLQMWRPVQTKTNHRYELTVEYLTDGGSTGLIKFPKSSVEQVALPASSEWTKVSRVFSGSEASPFRMELHSRGRGTDKGVYVKQITLQDLGKVAGAASESIDSTGQAEVNPPDLTHWRAPSGYYAHLVEQLEALGVPEGELLFASDREAEQAFHKYGEQHSRMEIQPLGATRDAPAPWEAGREIEITRGTANPWSANFGWNRGLRAVNKGDVALLSVWIQSGGSREANASSLWILVKDGKKGNFARLRAAMKNAPAPEWTQYLIPIEFLRTADEGQWKVEFFCGGPTQVLRFAGPALIYFGDSVAADDLPKTEFNYDYAGREADAPWRAAAAERIERHRKGDLTLKVVDASGNPVVNADVEVAMTRHAFGFGSEIAVPFFGDIDPKTKKKHSASDIETYREKVIELFNTVTIGTFKWNAWRGNWGPRFTPDETLEALAWANNNFYVHGHAPIWHQHRVMPWKTGEVAADPQASRAEILAWLESLLTISEVREQVDSWDAINHPFAFSQIWREYGEALDLPDGGLELHLDELDQYERFVPADTPLFVNEGNIMTRGASQLSRYTDYVGYLAEHDAPFDGVGFMCHFSPTNLTPPEELYARMEMLLDAARAHGRTDDDELKLRVTEFDVSANWNDPEQVAAQTDYTRDFYTLMFSHPNVDAIIAWGFWQGEMWKENAAWYTKDWQLRPNGKAYRDLVFDEWWTRETGRTDDQGEFTVRGFLGDYDIKVTRDGKSAAATTSLDQDGVTVSVIAP